MKFRTVLTITVLSLLLLSLLLLDETEGKKSKKSGGTKLGAAKGKGKGKAKGGVSTGGGAISSPTAAIYQWWHPTQRNYFYGTEDEGPTAESRGYVAKTLSFYLYTQQIRNSLAVSRYTDGTNVYLSTKADAVTATMTLDKVVGYTMSYTSFGAVFLYYTGATNSYFLISRRVAGDASGYQYQRIAFYSAARVDDAPATTAPINNPIPASPPSTQLPASWNPLDVWNLRGAGILDQGQCGACYAFSAATTMTYRGMIGGFSMSTNGIVSPQSILDCGAGTVYKAGPCDGGIAFTALQLSTTGVTTCSAGNCLAGCRPFSPDTIGSGSCPNKCVDGTTGPMYYGTNVYMVPKDKTVIKQELFQKGPLSASFNVYQSWLNFTKATPTAVYEPSNHKSGDVYKGGHAVVLIGWGSDTVGDYWIFQNSWSTRFGDNGFFYVRAGYDIFGLESYLFGNNYASSTPSTATKRDMTAAPEVGTVVALDPASSYAQELAKLVSQQFAASNPGFEFAWIQSAASQVIGGIRYELAVAGTNGELLSAQVLQVVGEAGLTDPQLVTASIVGTAKPIRGGKATEHEAGGGHSGGHSAAGHNGNGGNGGNGNGNGNANAETGLSAGATAGVIVGSVVAGLLAIGIAVGAAVFIYKKKNSREDEEGEKGVKEITTQPSNYNNDDGSDSARDRKKRFQERNPSAVNVFEFDASDKRRSMSITGRSPPILL